MPARVRVLLAATLAAAVPGPGIAAGAARCAPHAGERVVERGASAVLLEHRSGRVHGCWRSSGRRTRLFRPSSSFDGRHVLTFLKLSGGHAAVESVYGDRQGESYALRIVDLRRGRVRHSVTPFLVERPEGSRELGAVQQIVIAPDGDAAWIGRSIGNLEVRLRVYKADDEGMRELDPGPDVEARTLALSANRTVYWRTGGAARSAVLR